MLLRQYVVFIFFLLGLSTLLASTIDKPYSDNSNLTNPNKVEFIPPERIMSMYYKAVDRGDLIVFGIQLKRSMLVPVHVNYIYLVNGQTAKVKVYAKLKNPMQIPEQGNNTFTAVCAILDMFGAIVETEAHIFLK